MKSKILIILLALCMCPFSAQAQPRGPGGKRMPPGMQQNRMAPPQRVEQGPAKELKYIDVHSHLLNQNRGFEAAAQNALADMNANGIKTMILMPPPEVPGQEGAYTAAELAQVVSASKGRFVLMGGGGTLNPLIQQAVKDGEITDKVKKSFFAEVKNLLNSGIVGFGELTASHFSMHPKHPHIEAPPDHPLFLLLSDIAAKNGGMPIDIHMEAIAKPMKLSQRYLSAPDTPKTVQANMDGFERLLAHNRATPIVWDHLGWDNTGQRTPELVRSLLQEHPNLYMSLRYFPTPKAEPSVEKNRLVDTHGKLRPEWMAVFEEFPDRFVLGGDEFYMMQGGRSHGSTGSVKLTVDLLSQMPADLAQKIGYANAQKLYLKK